jgi:hypothetical protein
MLPAIRRQAEAAWREGEDDFAHPGDLPSGRTAGSACGSVRPGRPQRRLPAAVLGELKERYEENRRAFLAKDLAAIMALRTDDFHTVTPDSVRRDRADMEQYIRGLLNGIDRCIDGSPG